MSDETANFAAIARQDAERKRTWAAFIIAGLALVGAIWWAASNPFESAPDPDPVPSVSVFPTQALQRETVTTGATLPDAQPLTDEVLARVESMWSLVTYRGDVLNDTGDVIVSGPTIVYLVSPAAEVYEVVNLDALGADAVVAWDSSRAMVLVGFDGGQSLRSFNLATGAVGPAIDPCAGNSVLERTVGWPADNSWRLYTTCFPEASDNIFIQSTSVRDSGELVWDNHLVSVLRERTLKVSGDVHIVSRVTVPLDETGDLVPSGATSTHETITRGVTTPVATPATAPLCEVVGPGRAGSIAARCDNSDGAFLWELGPEGREPVQVLSHNQFPLGRDGVPLSAVASCATADTLAVQWAGDTGTEGALTTVQAGAVRTLMIGQHPATHCFGASGTRMLIGGVEGLALLDTATGDLTRVLTTPTPEQLGLDPGQWVRGAVTTVPVPMAGSEHQGVILAP